MLIDLDIPQPTLADLIFWKQSCARFGIEYTSYPQHKEISKGMYWDCGAPLHKSPHYNREFKDWELGPREMMNFYYRHSKYLNRYYGRINRGPYRGPSTIEPYGMVDSIEQFTEMTPHLNDPKSPFDYTVLFRAIFRSEQPESGGFRYGKHGKYYGTHKLKSDYLYSDEIDHIITFNIISFEKS